MCQPIFIQRYSVSTNRFLLSSNITKRNDVSGSSNKPMTPDQIKHYTAFATTILAVFLFVEERYAKQKQIESQEKQIAIQEKLIEKQHSQLIYIINTLSEENRKSIQQLIELEQSLTH